MPFHDNEAQEWFQMVVSGQFHSSVTFSLQWPANPLQKKLGWTHITHEYSANKNTRDYTGNRIPAIQSVAHHL
jgi:hypothetical protein